MFHREFAELFVITEKNPSIEVPWNGTLCFTNGTYHAQSKRLVIVANLIPILIVKSCHPALYIIGTV